jgi:hypothetical protein
MKLALGILSLLAGLSGLVSIEGFGPAVTALSPKYGHAVIGGLSVIGVTAGFILAQLSKPVAGSGAAFEAGSAITIPVPAETLKVDLTAEGLGHIEVTESGTTITIKKA